MYTSILRFKSHVAAPCPLHCGFVRMKQYFQRQELSRIIALIHYSTILNLIHASTKKILCNMSMSNVCDNVLVATNIPILLFTVNLASYITLNRSNYSTCNISDQSFYHSSHQCVSCSDPDFPDMLVETL